MFKNTNSYKLVSTIEKILIKNRFRNTILSIYQLSIYHFKQVLRLKIFLSNEKILDIYKEYFKEYFYLYTIIKSKNLNSLLKDQNLFYTITGFNLDAIITIKDLVRLYISYDLSTDDFQCHAIIDNKNFNIDNNNLKIKEIRNVCILLLKSIFAIIEHLLTELFINTVDECRNKLQGGKNNE